VLTTIEKIQKKRISSLRLIRLAPCRALRNCPEGKSLERAQQRLAPANVIGRDPRRGRQPIPKRVHESPIREPRSSYKASPCSPPGALRTRCTTPPSDY
jgi:hypothetical protein